MQVLQQIEKGIRPVDTQVSLGLTELKEMHAKWILDLIYVVKMRLFLMTSKLLALQRQLNQLIQC